MFRNMIIILILIRAFIVPISQTCIQQGPKFTPPEPETPKGAVGFGRRSQASSCSFLYWTFVVGESRGFGVFL